MKKYIEQRVKEVAHYIIQSKATIRNAAKVFKVSKSTIQRDISVRLLEVNPVLQRQIRKIMDYNFSIKSINGGQATKAKYMKFKNYYM